MVDKPENILVELDYNNIIIVDPNKIVDENGVASERHVRQEDLVMYANLECKVIPRTKLSLGTANNDAIQTISVASMNFLTPAGKTFLDNEYTDEITGKDTIQGKGVNQPKQTSVTNPKNDKDYYIRQTINSGGKPGSTDNGLLGITNITIKQNTSFMTTISIEMEDVKGRALFESGDNSPYAAFFNLPYPLFYLTIKGYYGKAVRLPIMLKSFTSRYNTSSGNFHISLSFLTYKYTILSEVSMGYLIAAPHMYKSRVKIQTTSGNASQFSNVDDTIYERGYQKVKEMYSEYKTKGLIPDDFPELTLVQMYNRIENFVKNILDTFSKQNLDPLSHVDEYQKVLINYGKDVYTAEPSSWFNTYMDKKSYFVLKKDTVLSSGISLTNSETRIYSFKPEFDTLKKQNDAISKLKGIIKEKNTLLNDNDTFGPNGHKGAGGSYTIDGNTKPCQIVCDIDYSDFPIEITSDDVDLVTTFKEKNKDKEPTTTELIGLQAELEKNKIFNSGKMVERDGKQQPIYVYHVFEGNKRFVDKLDKLSKELNEKRQQIETELTDALSKLLQSKDSGIGFVPNIRNVLAVIFANGEAFLRLMDDVHTSAWDQRDRKYRKDIIFDKQVAGASVDNLSSGDNSKQPVYPWPQLIVETSGEDGQEKYEITYPGDPKIINRSKGYLFDVWPEIEFVEEFIKGFTERTLPPADPTANTNELTQTQRVSLDAIEFPIGNWVYGNKEEVKFFFEIYERIMLTSYYSRLSRSNNFVSDADKLTNLIAESENNNIVKSLSNDNPFIIQKLREYGFNATNFTTILRQFSNSGLGESWQNYIRGIYNTPYIKNYVTNGGFEFINANILNSSESQPSVSLPNEVAMSEYITGSTTSNKFDLGDTFPFTNRTWDKTYLANGTTILDANGAFNTTKVLKYNPNIKLITSFITTNTPNSIRPITNFVYLSAQTPNVINSTNLKTWYQSRTFETQLITEGNVRYFNYSGEVTNNQTTSMLNTPYFINSIQQGVKNFRNNDEYPFIASAYLFINSLPLATMREKFKTYDNNTATDLDYIFAALKKFGAVHKLPYAWILKFGSIWHRYKTYIEKNIDILDTSWSGFSYTTNFDPVTSANTRNYGLIINGAPIDIVLQKDTTIGTEISTLINTGFYPKLINDFNVFCQGYEVFSGYTDSAIQSGITSGVSINYVDDAIINLAEGFDPTIPSRDLRIIPWSVSVDTPDTKYTYLMPSQGSLLNQTKNECFKPSGSSYEMKFEVNSNQAMYDGSVRLFWGAPNYGYFDNSKLKKPSPFNYMKHIFSGQSQQENFSINGVTNDYSQMSEMLSVFEKDVLDGFETEFLNFSKSVYDYTPGESGSPGTETEKTFKNFQMMFRSLLKVPKVTGDTGSNIVTKIQDSQVGNVTSILRQFLNYDVVFKYGNPSLYDKKLFYTFSTLPLTDPYEWEYYTVMTPNAVPTNGGGVSLITSKTNYPNEWSTLYTYVGFSEIPELVYGDNGSYITDFFVDLNVAFTVDNIKLFATVIKIYATQKLNQFQSNPIAPPEAPISSPSKKVSFTAFLSGDTITVRQVGPQKISYLSNKEGVILYESLPSFLPTTTGNTQTLINETIIAFFGSLSTVPTDKQFIVETVFAQQDEYPQVPNPTNKAGQGAFYKAMTNYLLDINNFQSKIIDNLMPKLHGSLPATTISTEGQVDSELQGNQTKVELWETFKALNDKWISGNDFKTKTLFEDVLLLDRASRNIGEKILVDVYKLKDLLNPDNINTKATMLAYVQTILVENHFLVMNIPSYVNFYNVQDAVKNPIPRIEGTTEFANTLFGTFLNVDYRDSSSKMVCFYAGKPSEQLDLKNNVDYRYRNDAFDLRRTSDNPLVENQVGKKDWDKSNKVVGFNVDIGPQNQQIFKSFQVDQSAGKATAEGLEVIARMANQAGGRKGSTQNTSLYNLYKNRSYGCQITMMGNAMMQPTMYFNLRHVPMFSGPYMILSVTHTINPGNFDTIIEGVRQPIASLPKVDAYLQSLKLNLLQSIITKNKEAKKQETKDAKGNVISQQNKVVSNANGGKELTQTQACTPASKYDRYIPITPQSYKVTFKEVIKTIKIMMSAGEIPDDGKLKYAVFAALYLESSTSTGLEAYENNFAGIDLSSSWGTSNTYFEGNPNYFCLKSDTTTLPYAVFDDLNNNVTLLLERWKNSMIILPKVSAKEITKFWVIYFGANKNNENVYSQMDPTQLSNIESKVQKSLDIYGSVSQIVPTPTPTPSPTPVPSNTVVPLSGVNSYTVANPPMFEKLTVTVNGSTGLYNIFDISFDYTVDSECGSGSGSGQQFNNVNSLISSNKQTFTVDIDTLLEEVNCNIITTSSADIKGNYSYSITVYSKPVLADGATTDPSRTDFYKSFPVTFKFT